MDTEKLVSIGDLKKIYRNYYLTGMSKLNIYMFDENDKSDLIEKIPSEYKDRVIIISAENLF